MTSFAGLILAISVMLALFTGWIELRRRRRAGARQEQRRNEESDAAGRPQQLLVQEWRDGRLVTIGTCVTDDERF